MEFNIVESDEPGYSKPCYTFDCPMCRMLPIKDLDRVYVRDFAWRHLVAGHKVTQSMVELVVVNAEAFEGLTKT